MDDFSFQSEGEKGLWDGFDFKFDIPAFGAHEKEQFEEEQGVPYKGRSLEGIREADYEEDFEDEDKEEGVEFQEQEADDFELYEGDEQGVSLRAHPVSRW
eukprot:3201435-Pyramimonas_sp.AAC.2